jgi:hypothetical protein
MNKIERARHEGYQKGVSDSIKSAESLKNTASFCLNIIVTTLRENTKGHIEAMSLIQDVLVKLQDEKKIVRFQTSSTEVIQGAYHE